MNNALWPSHQPADPNNDGQQSNPAPTPPLADTPHTTSQDTSAVPLTAELPISDNANGGHVSHFSTKLLKQKRWLMRPQTKLQWTLLIAFLILVLGGGGLTAYYFNKSAPEPRKTAPVVIKKPTPPPKPTTVASPLTGMQISPALAKRPVTGVMIENSLDARPQAGLKDAGVIYEAIAEAGITRFLALFQEAQPNYIGPVRSVRPYFLDFLVPFQAGVAHVGGSPTALSQIKSQGIRNLDQFFNAGAYWRISTRYAPHNMYTSMAKLDQLNKAKGFTSSTFTSFPRKEEAPSKQPTATNITFDISNYYYKVNYTYSASTNTYKRSEGGKPHLDDKSHTQLAPKVVIAVVMPYSHMSDGYHSQYDTTGSGKTWVFQDGTVTSGTWHKTSRKGQISFTHKDGTPIKLNPGQTWITLVGSTADISYK